MEGNKDESERCIKIAQKYIATGDTDKALKFLSKAERLFPSKRAKGTVYKPRFAEELKCFDFLTVV